MKLSNVNSTDIKAAIELGCRTMSNVFNADDNDIPFFRSEVLPNPRLSFSNIHSESHVPGRHLNALLTAEDTAGVSISEEAVEKHAAAAFFSYSSGPVPLPMNRDRVDGPTENFNDHNVREGLHALYALVRYRDSDRARELAESSIEFILQAWDPDKGWDRSGLESAHGIRWTRENTFITGIARAIGPLVKYYRATGYAKALELASLLAAKATSEFFLPDGSYDREKFGTHTHSTTCVMSSLAQLADLTGDASLLERVRAFSSNGLWAIRDELGWVIESSADDSPPDMGEGNNTGDIVETALILGRHGYPGYFQDAERILRGHLLPSQLRDVRFIPEPENPFKRRRTAKRTGPPSRGVRISRAVRPPPNRARPGQFQHGHSRRGCRNPLRGAERGRGERGRRCAGEPAFGPGYARCAGGCARDRRPCKRNPPSPSSTLDQTTEMGRQGPVAYHWNGGLSNFGRLRAHSPTGTGQVCFGRISGAERGNYPGSPHEKHQGCS